MKDRDRETGAAGRTRGTETQEMTTMSTLAATPTKLRSGAWGAKVDGAVREGDTVQITARSGKSWAATVSKVVWTGEGVSIVATESRESRGKGRSALVHDGRSYYRGRGRRDSRWTGCQCGSLEGVPRDSDCATCQHDY